MLSDLHERRLGESAAELAKVTGQKPPTQLCDVTNETQVQALVKAAIAELGHLDVLVNNAGLGGHAPIVETTDEQWLKILDVTLNGTFRMTRAVLPHMLARKRGAIVNNASVLGWRAQAGQAVMRPPRPADGPNSCAAMEAAPAGVRVNCVAPSLATHPFLAKVMPQSLLDELETREAFGRGAEPWEVANTIVFLASDYASYMTGEVLSVSSQRA
jgi:3-oxoacyl-[acyl-carrier protein] reductase